MIDAGLSYKALTQRLAVIGREPGQLQAVFLTHEHTDHIRGIGPLVRKHNLPLFTTEGTMSRIKNSVGNLPRWVPIREDEPVELEDMVVEPYATPHDAQESLAFVVHHKGRKLGHATDLGTVTPNVREKLRNSDALLVEANHDVDILNAGPYPWPLKQRIQSAAGHLSNEACAELLAAVKHDRLQHVVLMHLSQTNNHPEIAKVTAEQALAGSSAQMTLAHQDHPTPLIAIQ